MHSSIFLSLIAIASAFKIPEGQPGGTYVAFYDGQGVETHMPVDEWKRSEHYKNTTSLEVRTESSSAAAIAKPKVHPRQTCNTCRYNVWCGCGFEVDHSTNDQAVADLKAQLGSGHDVPGGTAFYSYRDPDPNKAKTVAFACGGGKGARVTANDVSSAAYAITQSCGWYIAGTMAGAYSDFGNVYIGYMRYTHNDFCKDSTSAGTRWCSGHSPWNGWDSNHCTFPQNKQSSVCDP